MCPDLIAASSSRVIIVGVFAMVAVFAIADAL